MRVVALCSLVLVARSMLPDVPSAAEQSGSSHKTPKRPAWGSHKPANNVEINVVEEEPEGAAGFDNSSEWSRALQLASPMQNCAPALPIGSWSGVPPTQPPGGSCNCGSTTRATTFTLACPDGFWATGTATCTRIRNFSRRNIFGACIGCNDAGESTATWGPSGMTSCTACTPPAAPSASVVAVSGQPGIWRWTCTAPNTFAAPVNRYCRPNAGTFDGVAINCQTCNPSPPIQQSAVYSGSGWAWTFSCARGYYGGSTTRTCAADSAAGTFSGPEPTCTACTPPVAENSSSIRETGLNANRWRYRCDPGWYGARTFRVCSTSSGEFDGENPMCTPCNDESGGFYCAGLDNLSGPTSNGRIPCPAGTYGLPFSTPGSPACSGPCSAGYFCPAGSDGPTEQVCGSPDVYCPTGSATPIAVSPGFYTTPLTAPLDRREGQAPCPAGRVCIGGLITPGVDWEQACPDGFIEAQVGYRRQDELFGPIFRERTRGYTGAVLYSLSAPTPILDFPEATPCDITGVSTTVTYNSVSNRMYIGTGWIPDFRQCGSGFSMELTATRAEDATLFATCSVRVRVIEVALPPIATFCGPIRMVERSPIGTAAVPALIARHENTAGTLLFSINTTQYMPFFVELCSGILRSREVLSFSNRSRYDVPILIRNDGIAAGLGEASSTCTVTINVVPRPRPFRTGSLEFSTLERVPSGTGLGNVRAVDPDSFGIDSMTLTFINATATLLEGGTTNASSAFDVYRVDNQGNLSVTGLSPLVSGTASSVVVLYTLNISNAFTSTLFRLSVTVLPAPIPPRVSTTDVVLVREGFYAQDTDLMPPLNGSSGRVGFTISWSVFPANLFDVRPTTGVLFVRNGTTLEFAQQSTYALAVTVTDSGGLTSTGSVAVRLLEVNRPPIWVAQLGAPPNRPLGQFRFQLAEGTLPSTAISSIAAVDTNLRGDAITYRIIQTTPGPASGPLPVQPFALDPVSGLLSVGPSIASSTGILVDQSAVHPEQYTHRLDVSATDNGSPPLSVNGTVFVQLINVRPRWSMSVLTVMGLAADIPAGEVVFNGRNSSWLPYNTSQPTYSATCQTSPSGPAAFSMNSTGHLLSLRDGQGNTLHNPNVQSSYACQLTVVDALTGLSASATLNIFLRAVNRPPSLEDYTFSAISLVSGSVGFPLSNEVDDLDLALGVGETFTFAIIGGNNDTTFAIDRSSGQITVANNNTASFQFRPGAAFFLRINITDAGINGPRLWSTSTVTIQLVQNQIPPTVPFVNLTVPEMSSVGRVVGTVQATTPNVGSTFMYQLAPSGANVNRPFPFAIRDVGTVNAAGEISVTGAGMIRFSPWNGDGMFRLYTATVTVVETRVGVPTQLTAQGVVNIHVTWVPEAPFFDSLASPPVPAGRRNSFTFRFAVPEHSPAGTQVNGTVPATGIVAFTKDPWKVPTLRYSWATPAPPHATWLRVDAVTGVLSLQPGVPDLSLTVSPSYSLTVRVVDSDGLADTASVILSVTDVNDVAVFDAFYGPDNRTVLAGASTRVSEDARADTLLGFVRFIDVDLTTPWNTRRYGILASAGSSFFTIDAQTGALRVSSQAALDWNNQPSFTLTITCTDSDPVAPLTGTAIVTIDLIQVNRVTVTGFAVAPIASSSSASVAGSPFATTHGPLHDVLFATAGSAVIIQGTAFGPTAARLVATSQSLSSTQVSATYGPTGREFTATGCVVVTANTAIQCTVPAGAGRGHTWSVTIAGRWNANSTRMTGYLPPAISLVTRSGGNPAIPSTQSMRTDAVGESIVVAATNLGPFVSAMGRPIIRLSYGPASRPDQYTSTSCLTVAEHTSVRCDAVPGVGANFVFSIVVTGQASEFFTTSAVRYTAPSITSVSSPILDTRGGEVFNVSGQHFGPAFTSDVQLTYSIDFAMASNPVFTAASCVVPATSPHTQLVCRSTAGVGSGLVLRVMVAGQSSATTSSPVTLSYRVPTVTDIGGVGADSASTRGGQQIVLSGDQFGPVTDLMQDGVPTGLFQPAARYGPAHGAGMLRYNGVQCRVSAAHTQMICLTAPGTGFNHSWQVTVSNQQSAVFTRRTTSYAPPTVAQYAGPGSRNAETRGAQSVVIGGFNFGPASTVPQLVTYGASGTEFTATGCSLTRPHEEITCNTTVGAGAGLTWQVTIDGQQSVSPSTAYGQPVILSFSGPGARDASTDGGDEIILRGRFLATQAFLGGVSYGPTGRDYTATGCRVTRDHEEITCRTVPGTDRILYWTVVVGGQSSDLSSATTSYAPPTLLSVDPRTGLTQGGSLVTLTGRDFGLTRGAVLIRFESVDTAVPRPTAAEWDAHRASMLAGGRGTTSVIQWIERLSSPVPILPSTVPRGNHSVSFFLPEGFGRSRAIFLTVDGVPSNLMTFSYENPVITNAAPDRLNVTAGQLRLFLDGTSFCSGRDGCGVVLVSGQVTPWQTYSHTRILLIVQDPAAIGQESASVQLLVGGTASNIVTYSAPVPSFSAVEGQGNWGGSSTEIVTDARLSFSVGLSGPGLSSSAVLAPSVAGPIRSAVARAGRVPTSHLQLQSVTDALTGLSLTVRPTDPANTVPAARRQLQGGSAVGVVNISFTMDAVLAMTSQGVSLSPTSVSAYIAAVQLALSASGSNVSSFLVSALSGALSSPASSFSAILSTSSFSQSIVTTTTVGGGLMSTAGGQPFFVKGVSAVATIPVADVSITIGGRRCLNLTKTQDGDLGPQYGVPANSPLASQYLTFELACTTPPGVGADLPIIITVPGGSSSDNPDFRFSYAPPTISAVQDASSGDSYTERVTAGGMTRRGVPTLGSRIRLVGSNFGEPSLLVNAPLANRLRVRIEDPLSGLVTDPVIISHTQTAIVVDVPPGQGKDLRISVTVGGQQDTDALPNQPARTATLIRYAEPAITVVFNADSGVQGGPTVGGTRLVVVGQHFGTASAQDTLESGRPVVTIAGLQAPLVTSFRAYSDHARIDCILPEGWGASLPVVVTVAGQSSVASVAARYTYAPPSVFSIHPSTGPTSGVRIDGRPILMTLTGSNLGRLGSVILRTVFGTGSDITVPAQAVISHNHTHMIFPMPEGAGADLQVLAVVGGQETPVSTTVFSYAAPVVTGLKNAARTQEECAPRVVLRRVGGIDSTVFVNQTVWPAYPGCYPTMPDTPYTVHLMGESFGSQQRTVRVAIGGRSCEVQRHTHNDIFCTAPAGLGDAVPILVTVSGRSNNPQAGPLFAYDPPQLTAVVPNRPDAATGQTIELYGHNFGPFTMPVAVSVGGKACRDAQWLNDGLLTCTTQPDTVGKKNMTVLAANRTMPLVLLEDQSRVEFRCRRGWYGVEGEVCVECGSDSEAGQERGAMCPGDELTHDLVLAMPGWWRYNVTDEVKCHPLRRTRARQPELYGGGCPSFVACEPAGSCLGANQCAPEYRGDRCALCARGFYRVSGECMKCPDSPWAVVIVFIVVALAALFLAYFLNSKNVNLALISIGMDWAQVVAMFARTRIRWPQLVKELFLILSAFNLNLELIAPECAFPGVTYAGKWLFIEGLPLFAWIALLVLGVTHVALKACLGRPKKKLFTHIPVLVATATVVQRVLYLYITRTTLDIFNCSPSDPPDFDRNGNEVLYMAWNLDIRCNEAGGSHLFLLPFAVAALAIYVVGFPCLSLWWLQKNKETVKYDQILRARLTGDDRLSNPHYVFRKTWKALYMNYRPGSWYWEFIVVLRKFLIAFCSLMFRRTPSYQLAMALLVLFVSYVLQVRHAPYLSHAQALAAVSDHRRKALEGSPLHVRIADEMRSRASHNMRVGQKQASFSGKGEGSTTRPRSSSSSGSFSETSPRQSLYIGNEVQLTAGDRDVEQFLASRRTSFQRHLLEARAMLTANSAFAKVFDYNTAEAVLLASALLVSLAGICFDSSRFTVENLRRKDVQAEYDGLAFSILVILFASILYWFTSLALDIAMVVRPTAVSSCLRNMTQAGRKAYDKGTAALQAAGGRAAKRSGRGGKLSGKSLDEGEEDINSVSLVNNPAVLASAMSARDGEGNGGQAVMDSSSISQMTEPPDQHAWAVIRASYVALYDRSKSTSKELELTKLRLESMGAAHGSQVVPRLKFTPLSTTGSGASASRLPKDFLSSSRRVSASTSSMGGRQARAAEEAEGVDPLREK